jgi:hypothetical protein
MSEQEKMDQLLRGMMTATPPPGLSSAFDQRLKRRLRPRRLNSTGRWIMAAYALFTLVVSIWAMRSQSIGWSLIGIAILAPLLLAVAIQYRQRPRTARRPAFHGR